MVGRKECVGKVKDYKLKVESGKFSVFRFPFSTKKALSPGAEGFSVGVGGDLLSHRLMQYHRHCRA